MCSRFSFIWPFEKTAHERNVGKIGKLVSLLIAEKQKVLKGLKVSRQWPLVLLVKWDWTESKTLRCAEVKVIGNWRLWVCSSKEDEHGQRSGKDSYIQCSPITQTALFFWKVPRPRPIVLLMTETCKRKKVLPALVGSLLAFLKKCAFIQKQVN